MGPFRGPGIYGGYGIYGRSEPDLRDYRTHPIIEQQLLNPSSQIWEPGNIFLRLHPEYLYPCLGERVVRASDVTVAPQVRAGAVRELLSLRKSIRRYYMRTGRRPGRPSKLTAIEREGMAAEHTRLYTFIRQRCAVDVDARPAREELNRLFRDPEFQRDLFSEFPLKQSRPPQAWKQFLKNAASLALSKRSLHFLALRYGVQPDTIHRAIWPERRSGPTAPQHT